MQRIGSSILPSNSTEGNFTKLEGKFSGSLQTTFICQDSQQGTKVTGNGQEGELRYEAESPDEAALVYAARAYNFSLVGRLSDQVTLELPHLGRLNFELLHTLGFDSTRKRMSVVVRHPLTEEIIVYTKGADSVVLDLVQACPKGRNLSLFICLFVFSNSR